jgi:hypothetical protein
MAAELQVELSRRALGWYLAAAVLILVALALVFKGLEQRRNRPFRPRVLREAPPFSGNSGGGGEDAPGGGGESAR